MIIAIASGKGGTGKTTVAVNLAQSLTAQYGATPTEADRQPVFLDCDVEEPNAALFLKPILTEPRVVGQMVPQVDLGLCTRCGRCAEVCQYHAIAVAGDEVLVFPEMCHGCGSCTLNCPVGAISEVLHAMGTIEQGTAGSISFAQGTMYVGEAMPVPIIRALREQALPSESDRRPVLLDAPPGTACPVVETLREADVALLVTEPTPFGLHDLRIAVEVARGELGLPVGVVINRVGVGDDGVDRYCSDEGIPVLMRIPLDRRIAEAYAVGVTVIEALPDYAPRFRELYVRIAALASSQPRL